MNEDYTYYIPKNQPTSVPYVTESGILVQTDASRRRFLGRTVTAFNANTCGDQDSMVVWCQNNYVNTDGNDVAIEGRYVFINHKKLNTYHGTTNAIRKSQLMNDSNLRIIYIGGGKILKFKKKKTDFVFSYEHDDIRTNSDLSNAAMGVWFTCTEHGK
jgi:hypothetical protein